MEKKHEQIRHFDKTDQLRHLDLNQIQFTHLFTWNLIQN